MVTKSAYYMLSRHLVDAVIVLGRIPEIDYFLVSLSLGYSVDIVMFFALSLAIA